MAPADVELVRPASAEHKVLRHGTEEQFQAQVGWDCQEHPTVGSWLSSPSSACWLAAGPTQDKQSGSTDLHYLCSNPMITISMLTAVHRRRALTEGKDSVKPFDDGPYLALHELQNQAGLTPLHNLCGNLHLTYALMIYTLEQLVCPCKYYTDGTCTHSCCAEAAVNAHDLTSESSDGTADLDGAAKVERAAAGERGADRGVATPLHLYTRGLPMSVEVLNLLLAAAGGPDGNSSRTACAIPDAGFQYGDISSILAKRHTTSVPSFSSSLILVSIGNPVHLTTCCRTGTRNSWTTAFGSSIPPLTSKSPSCKADSSRKPGATVSWTN